MSGWKALGGLQHRGIVVVGAKDSEDANSNRRLWATAALSTVNPAR